MPSKYASLSVSRSSVDEIRGAVMRHDGIKVYIPLDLSPTLFPLIIIRL
jgi:hypothetical protein